MSHYVPSMPGSAYFNITRQVADWLSVVPECNINSSTKEVVDKLSDISLPDNTEMISFDIVSLYANDPNY